ncbi:heme oxygenase-like protein [Hypoxylon sp. FL1857]|nr:heme oxygenase-like protein [Hypoxylon sp. FL1857]
MPSKTEDAIAAPEHALGESINIATRSVHTKLNKLIIQRLRLALPPQADDASNYVQGLLHVAPIYITFESLWRTILESSETEDGRIRTTAADCPEPSDAHSSPTTSSTTDAKSRPTISNRIHVLLLSLYIDGLPRSSALKHDLASLTGWTAPELTAQLDERAAESPVLAEFLAHIKRSVAARPHVLLAYAWVLYMALFSGGRFIRASLERVDPASSFWTPLELELEQDFEQDSELKMPGGFPSSGGMGTGARRGGEQKGGKQEEHPLAFFRFDTPSDGEDLKNLFKARLLTLTGEGNGRGTSQISPQEHDDVVQEAQRIFDFMISVVGELDEVCGTDRDSLVVEKEKRKRLAARGDGVKKSVTAPAPAPAPAGSGEVAKGKDKGAGAADWPRIWTGAGVGNRD